jgi:hypothetical protein
MTADDLPAADHGTDSQTLPPGVPNDSGIRRVRLTTGGFLEMLLVPTSHSLDPSASQSTGQVEVSEIVSRWIAATPHASRPLVPPSVVVPLYDCLVGWAAGRAAVVGPPDRLATLEATVIEFASREAELRAAEAQASQLMDAVASDAAASAASDHLPPEHRSLLARRYIEAVDVSRRLAALAPALHAPPLHPPTLATQLGERLRDRTRLRERHELATEQTAIAERVAEASRQRADELAIARKQMRLEWAIVVLLVVQTTLLVVDLLARQGTP